MASIVAIGHCLSAGTAFTTELWALPVLSASALALIVT